jgi:hypothetical protein
MAHVTLLEVQAWLEGTKLTLSSLDASLEEEISNQVLARLAMAYPNDYVTWTNETTTPKLVRSIIAMMYAGWFYDRQYSENPEDNSYADRLRAAAQSLLDGILAGTIDIIEVAGLPLIGQPLFYPTDASSAPDAVPTLADPAAGPAAFSMGKIF